MGGKKKKDQSLQRSQIVVELLPGTIQRISEWCKELNVSPDDFYAFAICHCYLVYSHFPSALKDPLFQLLKRKETSIQKKG